MVKDETIKYEKQRVMLAEELRIAPDELDLSSVLSSVFRAVRVNCENSSDEVILTIKNEQEEKAILSPSGQEVISRIFADQHPFENVVNDYKGWYMSLLEDIAESEE